jgi:hypothetical protein
VERPKLDKPIAELGTGNILDFVALERSIDGYFHDVLLMRVSLEVLPLWRGL